MKKYLTIKKRMSFTQYPANLRYIMNKLTGFSRSRVRMPILTPTSASQNDIIIFEIPSGVKFDPSTLAVHFNLTTTNTGGATPSCYPPKHTNCMIQTLSVDVNGLNVQTTDNYSHWHSLWMSYCGGDRTQALGSHIEFTNNYPTASINSCMLTNVPLVFRNFMGILGSSRIIDTNLTGPIRVQLRLSPINAFVQKGGGTNTYSLSSMTVHFDTIQINDGIFDQMIASRLANGDTIPFTYNNYLTYLGQQTASVDQAVNRFSINVQSLDYIFHTLLPSDYNSAADINTTFLQSPFFLKGEANRKITGAQLQVGSSFVPNFRQNGPAELFSMTCDAMGIGNDVLGSTDSKFVGKVLTGAATSGFLSDSYTYGYFLAGFRLCAGSQYDLGSSLLSGLDTRGANTLLSVTTYADSGSAAVIPMSICQFTSTLQIGAGRQLQLIM